MAYPDEVLKDRPLAYWRMDDLLDQVGRSGARNLVQGGTPSRVPGGIVGDLVHGRLFNGSTDYFSVAIDLSGYAVLAIEAWMVWPAFANNDIIAWAFGSAGDRFFFDPNSSAPFAGSMQVAVTTTGNANAAAFSRFSAGAWHHVVTGFNRSTGGALGQTLWVDGVQQAATGTSITGSVGSPATFPNSTLFFGSYFGPTLFSSATMHDVALYGGGVGAGGPGGGQALSYDRIQAHYSAGRNALWSPRGRALARRR